MFHTTHCFVFASPLIYDYQRSTQKHEIQKNSKLHNKASD